MAAPAAVPGALQPGASTGMTFGLSHDCSPDLTDSQAVAALGQDPPVLLTGHDHKLVCATPDAGWIAAP